MKAPKKYTDNLKEGIITREMLVDCLYSSNRRALNYRDKENELREYYCALRKAGHGWDKYHNETKAKERKKIYFRQKKTLLSVIDPVCIHQREIPAVGTEYYLFYDIGDGDSFHIPISDPKDYKDLKIVKIDEMRAEGNRMLTDLISNQFVKKVIELIESGEFELRINAVKK